jgi:hypothetical protein
MSDGFMTPRKRQFSRRGRYAIALSALLVLVLIPFQQSAGAATRVSLWVKVGGTDAGNCKTKTAPCATITYALTQAPSTGTNINMLSDIDDEVTVTKDNVTIQSSPTTSTFKIRPTTDTLSTTTPAGSPVNPIVFVQVGRTGIKLSNVIVDGGGRPTAGSCSPGLGHTGIYMKGGQLNLTKTQVLGVTQGPGLEGCQNGSAVRVDANSNLTVNLGKVAGYDKNGITCNGVGTTCTLTKVEADGSGGANTAAKNGIQISRGAVATVAGAKVHDHEHSCQCASGILIYNAGSGVLVKNSIVTDNDNGIFAYRDGTSGAGTSGDNVTLSANIVSGGLWGVGIDSLTGATVVSNKVSGTANEGIGLYSAVNGTIKTNQSGTDAGGANGLGMYVGGLGTVNGATPSSGNQVTGNKLNGNSGDGIEATALSSTNTFGSNTLNLNVGYGAHDESTGANTAGTANAWTGNKCPTPGAGGKSSPVGLCN